MPYWEVRRTESSGMAKPAEDVLVFDFADEESDLAAEETVPLEAVDPAALAAALAASASLPARSASAWAAAAWRAVTTGVRP